MISAPGAGGALSALVPGRRAGLCQAHQCQQAQVGIGALRQLIDQCLPGAARISLPPALPPAVRLGPRARGPGEAGPDRLLEAGRQGRVLQQAGGPCDIGEPCPDEAATR